MTDDDRITALRAEVDQLTATLDRFRQNTIEMIRALLTAQRAFADGLDQLRNETRDSIDAAVAHQRGYVELFGQSGDVAHRLLEDAHSSMVTLLTDWLAALEDRLETLETRLDVHGGGNGDAPPA